MRQYVKVVCSRDTGNTGPAQQRWNTGTSNRGFADWTILTEGVDRIKRDFVNITDVVDKVKDGEHEEAKNILNKVTKGVSSAEVSTKIDDLKNNRSLTPSVSAYNNIVKLIKNLKLHKTIKKDSVSYTLVSTFDENAKDYADFQEKIKTESKLWQISNENKWIMVIVQAITKLAAKHMR
jgi:hypothetical protein